MRYSVVRMPLISNLQHLSVSQYLQLLPSFRIQTTPIRLEQIPFTFVENRHKHLLNPPSKALKLNPNYLIPQISPAKHSVMIKTRSNEPSSIHKIPLKMRASSLCSF